MKWISSLLLWQRFAILGAVALILVSVPTYMFYVEALKPFRVARAEHRASASGHAMLAVIQLTQEHRSVSAHLLGGRNEALPRRQAKFAEVNQALAAADAVLKRDVDNAELLKLWAQAQRDWKTVSAAVEVRTDDALESIDAHTALISRQLQLMELLADHFLLSFDPEPHTSHLMKAAYFDIPQLTEMLGRSRARGTAHLTLDSAPKVSPPPGSPKRGEKVTFGGSAADGLPMLFSVSDRVTLGALLDRARDLHSVVVDDLKKAGQYEPGIAARLEADIKPMSARVDAAIKLADAEIVKAPLLTYDSTPYLNSYTDAIRGVYALNSVVLDLLDKELASRVASFRARQAFTLGAVLSLAVVGALSGLLIARSVYRPVDALMGVIQRMQKGDADARAGSTTPDEIGELARQFDQMVDEREAVAGRSRTENERLNASVMVLLDAVAKLAQRDLTVKVPVTEDVTGPVADALNLLTSETAKVLREVNQISSDVNAASVKVKLQSDTVAQATETGREQADRTSEELATAGEAVAQIARLAQSSSEAAANAIATTKRALEAVTATVGGINATRETIRETEKRIKRLGERSQEISGVVSLINTIAERTHILALNASMHAASAGEAGRGFAVVADEVQRLAENARQATAQITGLVNNIQIETADTVNTMNAAISQVVEGSRLAERAGEEMRQTQTTTAELVASVQEIAANSKAQVHISDQLRSRADEIRKMSARTSAELKEQTVQTASLVEYADRLLGAVRVFKLSA